jgi:tRNA (mo5U34)-methyltransferase
MVLETLVLPEDRRQDLLVPQERHARMKNVWAVPGTGLLRDWVRKAGFRKIELVDTTRTTIEEQRSTTWMQFESLAESLDPENSTKTIEGHPAPARAVIIAEK